MVWMRLGFVWASSIALVAPGAAALGAEDITQDPHVAKVDENVGYLDNHVDGARGPLGRNVTAAGEPYTIWASQRPGATDLSGWASDLMDLDQDGDLILSFSEEGNPRMDTGTGLEANRTVENTTNWAEPLDDGVDCGLTDMGDLDCDGQPVAGRDEGGNINVDVSTMPEVVSSTGTVVDAAEAGSENLTTDLIPLTNATTEARRNATSSENLTALGDTSDERTLIFDDLQAFKDHLNATADILDQLLGSAWDAAKNWPFIGPFLIGDDSPASLRGTLDGAWDLLDGPD